MALRQKKIAQVIVSGTQQVDFIPTVARVRVV